MDEEIERLVVSVRADTGAFRRDVEDMRASLSGPLAAGAARAGDLIENALLKAVRTGKFGFEDLKRIALSAMAEIAQAALRSCFGAGGVGGLLGGLLTALLGAPGRATGGPVAPGRAYMVGERGPELFVPTASGRIEAGAGQTGAGQPRDVRVTIQIVAPAGFAAPQMLEQSGRQVAAAVRRALRD